MGVLGTGSYQRLSSKKAALHVMRNTILDIIFRIVLQSFQRSKFGRVTLLSQTMRSIECLRGRAGGNTPTIKLIILAMTWSYRSTSHQAKCVEYCPLCHAPDTLQGLCSPGLLPGGPVMFSYRETYGIKIVLLPWQAQAQLNLNCKLYSIKYSMTVEVHYKKYIVLTNLFLDNPELYS